MNRVSTPATGSCGCYLSVAAVFKNEAPYLDEWLAFCMLEGVERVLLYDHCSTDNARDVLMPWIDAGFVELTDWPVPWKEGAQVKAFADALRRSRGHSRWVAFIDVDEFLFSPSGEKVSEVLRRYEAHAGVVVNWQCYGSSGHKHRPHGLTVESYTRRARSRWVRNYRVKTIVDPLLATEPYGAHLFEVLNGRSLVTEDFKPVRVFRSAYGQRHLRHLAAWFPNLPLDPYSIRQHSPRQVSVSALRINHYATRSEEELASKYKDRKTMREHDRRAHGRYHNRNEVEDPILRPRADRIRGVIATIRRGACESS